MKKLLLVLITMMTINSYAQSAYSQDVTYDCEGYYEIDNTTAIISNTIGEAYYQVNGIIDSISVPTGWWYMESTTHAQTTVFLKKDSVYKQIFFLNPSKTFIKVANFSNQNVIW